MTQAKGLPQLQANNLSNVTPSQFNRVSPLAWYFLTIITIATFLAFMLLDPNPDLLLAICSAVMVAILLKATYNLYEWGLLLSPMSAAIVGPGWIVFYTWGNLGAKIAGEGRYGSNFGSLDYFGVAALLCTIGLYVYYLIVFVVFAKQIRKIRIRYEDFYWRPWNSVAATLLAVGVIYYLSLKYPFVGGYFRGVNNSLDQWLSASLYYFVTLGVIIGVSVAVKHDRAVDRLIGLICLFVLVIVTLGLRSRTYMILMIVQTGLCWITLRPRQLYIIIPGGLALVAGIFVLGTVVKLSSGRGLTGSVGDNLSSVSQADIGTIEEANLSSFDLDLQYRTAGLEYPATLLFLLDLGVSPLYGEGMYQGALQGLPDFLRPIGQFSERNAIGEHFIPQGLQYGDTIGVPLTSGIADFGMLGGSLIYIIIAAYCLFLWWITQISPRFFVVFLSVGVGAVGDLFWENASTVLIKGMGFMYIVVILFGPVLLPRWLPDQNTAAKNNTDLEDDFMEPVANNA